MIISLIYHIFLLDLQFSKIISKIFFNYEIFVKEITVKICLFIFECYVNLLFILNIIKIKIIIYKNLQKFTLVKFSIRTKRNLHRKIKLIKSFKTTDKIEIKI